jgi:hypothetical protein
LVSHRSLRSFEWQEQTKGIWSLRRTWSTARNGRRSPVRFFFILIFIPFCSINSSIPTK